jgi:hypothetical protein
MSLTARALNRATLGRQMLLERQSLPVEEALRRVVALQAQHPASPYLALWNRLRDFDAADLDAAYDAYAVVRSTLLRVTMHAVHADDYPAFRVAMEPTLRGSRLGDRRFTSSGLAPEDADALLPALLDFAAEPRSIAECKAWLTTQWGDRLEHVVWQMLRQYAPLWHVPVGPPWSFETERSYLAASHCPPLADAGASEAGLQTLIKRYLAGFGPASMPDMAQFALVQRSRVKAALQALGEDLVQFSGPNGVVLYDLPGAALPSEEIPAPPRLLGMWDNVLFAYLDRSRVIPEPYRKLVIRINGDSLPTLLVDGYVAGVWRVAEGGIEATAFHPLPDETWHALAVEARNLLAFLADRDPTPYRRYDHWWTKLPDGETQILPGD